MATLNTARPLDTSRIGRPLSFSIRRSRLCRALLGLEVDRRKCLLAPADLGVIGGLLMLDIFISEFDEREKKKMKCVNIFDLFLIILSLFL